MSQNDSSLNITKSFCFCKIIVIKRTYHISNAIIDLKAAFNITFDLPNIVINKNKENINILI